LECLMTGNPSLEILLPLHYLWKDHTDSFTRFFPGTSLRPAAFWVRTKKP
jgi:hypothetical protein